MNFTYPAFLSALALIAIPIIIHLINLRRYKKVYFSNVSLLQQIQTQSKKKRQIREYLILASRILFIAALVFAFAQPFIPGSEQDLNAKGPQYVSMYIDNSYSMEKPATNGNLFSESLKLAETIIKAHKAEDRFQILTNDFSGQQMHFMNRQEALAYLPEIQISPAFRNFRQIHTKQSDLLHTYAGSSPMRIFMLSDFAENIMQWPDKPIDSMISVWAYPLQTPGSENIGFDSIWSATPTISLQSPNEFGFRVVNNSNQNIEDLPVRVFLNGEQKTPALISVPAQSKAVGNFVLTITEPGFYQGYLELDDASMSFDNRFYFSFSVKEKMEIALIKSAESTTKTAHVFEDDPQFALRLIQENNPDFSQWKNYDLLIVSELKSLASGWHSEFSRFFENGGVSVFFPNPDYMEAYNALMASQNLPLPGNLRRNELKGGKLHAEADFFYGVFEKDKKNWNDVPQVYSYFPLKNPGNIIWQPLFTLANNDVVLAWCKTGNGYALVSGLPLSDAYSNLATHSVFVPLLLKSAFLSQQNKNLYYNPDDPKPLTIPFSAPNSDAVLALKSVEDESEIIPEQQVSANMVRMYLGGLEMKSGNYYIMNGSKAMETLSVNFGSGEGAALPLNEDKRKEWSNAFPNLRFMDADNPELIVSQIEQMQSGILLWKWFLALAIASIMLEVIFIRFLR